MLRLTVLSIAFGDAGHIVYPVILQDEHEMISVDCGVAGSLPLIQEAAEKENLDLSRLTKVILTHHDHDHIGSLAALKRIYPALQVCASEEETPYIEGKKKPLRLQRMEAVYDYLTDIQKESVKRLQQMYSGVEWADVDIAVRGHAVFPCCGGVEIVPTPGHMPGHIAVYAQEFKTLIAGDALLIDEGNLAIGSMYTLDMKTARESARKLSDYDIQKIVCYHGGVFEGDVKAALLRIAEE